MANKNQTILPRHFTPPDKQSYFLFGPRGTGKTRFLKSFYENIKFIDLLDDKTYMRLNSSPEQLEPIVMGLKKNDYLLIDEVQKAPSLLSKIHQIMEDDDFPKIRFILTGSSSRKLKKSGVDLLAGRAVIRTMHPFMASELKEKFNLDKALIYGTVPVVFNSPDPESTLAAYIATYLREEVKQEGLVKNLESFSRFLEVMTFCHGEILNLNNVSRDSSVRRSTIDGYLEVLEDLLLAYRIPPFKKRNRKNTVDSDKFYYFDSGVFNALLPSGLLDENNNYKGQSLEGLVLQNLRAWVSYRNQNENIFFWRTEAGNEVDFIVYGKTKLLAIEVKNSKKIKKDLLSGLKSFKEDYPEAECIFLYRGKTEELHGNVRCIPVEKFLLSLDV